MLTFADPVLAGGAETEAQTRNATLLQGLRLGRLPHAREESRAIERHVGGVEALVGASASEKALKSRDLGGYDILHFAAHAVADEAHPERSAVLLAPGDAMEDGLLQVPEIEALDLDGRIVVLSACQTAAGAVLSGEGVLSLARAFFEAGAHAVVGSRWPLRDADAAALFDAFYRHLARGASLSEALKAAQDDARAAGRPASAWAGLVLLGNGDLRPFAGRRSPANRGPATLIAVTATLLVAIVVFAQRLLGGDKQVLIFSPHREEQRRGYRLHRMPQRGRPAVLCKTRQPCARRAIYAGLMTGTLPTAHQRVSPHSAHRGRRRGLPARHASGWTGHRGMRSKENGMTVQQARRVRPASPAQSDETDNQSVSRCRKSSGPRLTWLALST